MKFVVDKEAGGWWFVREIVVGGGRTKEEVITECRQRNERRLDSKQRTAQMANKEYRRAKKSYPTEPIVYYVKSKRAHLR